MKIEKFNDLKVCKICGCRMYITESSSELNFYHCSSDEAKFWDFDRGSKEQLSSKKHWDDSKQTYPK